MLSFIRTLCIAAASLACLSALAAAGDPPGRIGRLSHIEGNVSFYADREEGWRPAELNYPVTSENSIWVEDSGLAEVRVGASALRFADDTVFDFVRLADDGTLGFLQRGSVQLRLRQYGVVNYNDNVVIDTANGRFILDGGGRYRVDAPSEGQSRVSVFFGRAHFESGDTRLTIEGGKSLNVRLAGTVNDFRFERATVNGFDEWAIARDDEWDRAHDRYSTETVVSPYMTGYEQLDSYGEWIEEPDYGRVWAPRVAVADWAPYRYGRWSYVRPWGWTWVDDAPWGFAPFHYGRWVQVRSRWCWWPGPYTARPVYAPALVAWLGTPALGISISSGPAVGWFPLGPREHYVPRYGHTPAYLHRINHVPGNVPVRPPASYRNQVPGATVVNNGVFINSRPVGSNLSRLSPALIAQQPPTTGIDLRPGRGGGPRVPGERRPDNAASVPHPRFAPPVGKTYSPPPQPAATGPMPVPAPTPRAYPAPNAVPAPANVPPAPQPGYPYEPRQPRQRPQPQPQAQPQFQAPASPPAAAPGGIPPPMAQPVPTPQPAPREYRENRRPRPMPEANTMPESRPAPPVRAIPAPATPMAPVMPAPRAQPMPVPPATPPMAQPVPRALPERHEAQPKPQAPPPAVPQPPEKKNEGGSR